MKAGEIIMVMFLFLVAVGSFTVSFLQFREKGILLNNAYFYASKGEREKMDKKPHYKQSGIIFLLAGVIFSINVVELLLDTGWLYNAMLTLILVTIGYAIVSSVKIAMKNAK